MLSLGMAAVFWTAGQLAGADMTDDPQGLWDGYLYSGSLWRVQQPCTRCVLTRRELATHEFTGVAVADSI